MRNLVTTASLAVLVSLLISGCGKKAEDYESIVSEYKKVVCVGMSQSSSLSEKTQALQRQQELNKEYQDAINNLSNEEKSKLMLSWAKALAEASEGKCN